jgi:hypothetical protein
MPAQQAKSSLSNAEYLICAGSNFLEKNARGCHGEDGDDLCCNAAPTQSEEASTLSKNFRDEF